MNEWICECGNPACEGTHQTASLPVPPVDLIIDPERYWRAIDEQIKSWRRIEESDATDVPTFL